jgi:penicillin-binding protein 1A
VVGALLFVGLAVAAFSAYSALARQLPDPTKQLLGTDQSSRVYDRNGKLLADLFAEQNRRDVPLSTMPPALRQAVVATEDQRFYQHAGVDPLGMARAVITDVVQGRSAQGGSTITQQYVKNAFTDQQRTLKRKVMEAMLAFEVERKYSKDRILEMYLNTIYFGHGAYGVERAAEVYFGKTVEKLDTAESAMLAGVIKSPGRYSPHIDPKAARARRHTVLAQMRDQGYLSDAAYRSADAEPLRLAKLRKSSVVAPYFIEYVKSTLVDRFGADAVYRGGLSVRTTLDTGMQDAAEAAVARTLDRKGDPSAAVVAIDPADGEIRAMVGGSDFATQQFNVAVQGHRQPGSAFKAFVLAAALQSGVSPEQTFECGPVELTPDGATKPWKVTGAGGERTGPMRLREATEKSVNSVFAQLILQIGPAKVAEAAKSLGIVSPVEANPAIALGGLAHGVSPLEMASAYGTLANEGVRTTPHGILDVKDATGKIVYTEAPASERAVSAPVAYLETNMLEGVIARGTGTGADIGRIAAGKTGTTQAYRDAWFCGYTPQLSAAVWVGYPDAAKAMTSVHGRSVTGGSFPADIWARFMRQALSGSPERDFPRPATGLATATVCLDTGLLATDFCPHKGAGLFLADALPKRCNVHITPLKFAVPNVVGLSASSATAALKKAGFVTALAGSGAATGTVTAQRPGAGVLAAQGTTVTVTVGKPAAALSASFTFAMSGRVVAFDARGSTGKMPLAFTWDFGDGAKGEGKKPSHTYASKGARDVVLRVRNASGATASMTARVTIP